MCVVMESDGGLVGAPNRGVVGAEGEYPAERVFHAAHRSVTTPRTIVGAALPALRDDASAADFQRAPLDRFY